VTTIVPAVELTPAALEEIRNAIVHGYDKASMTDRLRFTWGLELGDEFNTDTGFKFIAGDLVKFAEREGKVAELLGLAYAAKPQNPKLSAAAQKYLADPQAAIDKYVETAPPPLLPNNLEAVITTRSRLFKYGEFLARLHAVGNRLCRIEIPDGGGTGWLVGASHVLTNYHVVQAVALGQLKPDKIVCRFDFWSEESDAAPKGTAVRVRANGLIAVSEYSESDLTGTGTPNPDQLDYGLLRLARPIGNSTLKGGKRGWFELPEKPPIIARGDPAMIPQHPDARALEVAFGRVLEFPGVGLRYRYDVTTEHGSSGSPVFNADLTLFGLHHAADPAKHPAYNQAVPLWRIARDLSAKQYDWTG
jgi:hypothetical protein